MGMATPQRTAVSRILESDPRISVMAEIEIGRRTVFQLERLNPDLLVLVCSESVDDTVISWVQAVMSGVPRPIVMVCHSEEQQQRIGQQVLRAGAVDVLCASDATGASSSSTLSTELIQRVVGFSHIPVVTRKNSPAKRKHPIGTKTFGKNHQTESPPLGQIVLSNARVPRLIAIGASTGGPPVLQALLMKLPAPFPVPIAIVQHMSHGYIQGLADWLKEVSGHETIVCSRHLPMEKGRVYVAPEEMHLKVLSRDSIGCSPLPREGSFCPSVDVLFSSAATHLGSHAWGILLTGMGSDGAIGMAQMHSAGAITLVQKSETCVVSSMPQSAIRLGAAVAEQSVDEMAKTLCDVTFGAG